jgi:hypothetical protein
MIFKCRGWGASSMSSARDSPGTWTVFLLSCRLCFVNFREAFDPLKRRDKEISLDGAHDLVKCCFDFLATIFCLLSFYDRFFHVLQQTGDRKANHVATVVNGALI